MCLLLRRHIVKLALCSVGLERSFIRKLWRIVTGCPCEGRVYHVLRTLDSSIIVIMLSDGQNKSLLTQLSLLICRWSCVARQRPINSILARCDDQLGDANSINGIDRVAVVMDAHYASAFNSKGNFVMRREEKKTNVAWCVDCEWYKVQNIRLDLPFVL